MDNGSAFEGEITLTGLFPEPDPNPYAVVPERMTTDLSEMAGTLTQQLHRYWQALAPDGAVPLADDFQPLDIYQAAPWLLLLDVVREDDSLIRHRYRYVGTEIVNFRLRRGLADHTGAFVDEAPRYYTGALLEESYHCCSEGALPVLTMGAWRGAMEAGRFERLAVPLVDDSGQVVRLAVLVDRFEKILPAASRP